MSRLLQTNSNQYGIPLNRPRIEAQCEQIFQRASSINKDLINIMQNSPIAKKQVFGFELRKIWILATLLLLFSGSFVGSLLFWFTDSFENYVLKNMVIINGTDAYNNWVHGKAKPHVRIHIYNYTNVDTFEKGIDTKLRVQILGPYVYDESLERTNIHFENDGTVSYQNIFRHSFLPHLSKGKENDIVIVPNLMMLTAAKRTEDMDYLARLAAAMTLGNVMNQKPFLKLAAHRFIWGYEDQFYNIAKGFLQFQQSNMIEQVGLMSNRNGTSPMVITLQTGQKNMKNHGMITKLNGFDTIGKWSTEECDSVKASDGVFFERSAIRSKQKIEVFVPDSCRKYPYYFEKEVFIVNGTVPAYRYIMPESIFDSAKLEPSNQCYCDHNSGICPPQGFYNVSACIYGAPVFISQPFFKNVPTSYIKVDGIPPYHGDLSSYLDIHPVWGYTMSGASRFQINALAKNYQGFYSMDIFDDDGVMLPLAWVETILNDKNMGKELMDTIYLSTFTVKQIEMAAKYISFLTTIITVAAICIILKPRIQRHEHNNVAPSRRLNA